MQLSCICHCIAYATDCICYSVAYATDCICKQIVGSSGSPIFIGCAVASVGWLSGKEWGGKGADMCVGVGGGGVIFGRGAGGDGAV